jgi:hypothetical protein
MNYKGLRIFKKMSEVTEKLLTLSGADFVVNMVAYYAGRLQVHRALSKSRASYAVSSANLFPQPSFKKKLPDILIGHAKAVAGLGRKRAWQLLTLKLPHNWLGVRSSDILFTSGSDIRLNRLCGRKTRTMNIHAFDYDRYLAQKDRPGQEKGIAVFLDEFLPFHPDFILCNDKSPVIAEKYYVMLNRFFDLVEAQTGLKVVIAAHPRSDYENRPDFFNGRTCVRGMTAELVRDCKLVLMHVSTAINYAVLFHKPIIFITCAEIDRSWEGPQVREFARWFDKAPIFIDRENTISWEKELSMDPERYRCYRQAYIKTDGSEDLPFWQVVADRLKKGISA